MIKQLKVIVAKVATYLDFNVKFGRIFIWVSCDDQAVEYLHVVFLKNIQYFFTVELFVSAEVLKG